MRRELVTKIILFLMVTICFQSFGLADAWRATDSASAYGRSSSVLPGTDIPAARTYNWFAPDRGQHDMWFYDYDNSTNDIVVDSKMKWLNTAISAFQSDPKLNLVHQIIVQRNLYEADSYFSSNFPYWSHNEDESELEETYQGYEEKELGTLYPEKLGDYSDIQTWTYWTQLANGSGNFTSDCELTKEGFPDDWVPVGHQELGSMAFTTPAPKPDIVPTAVSAPSTGVIGGSISISASLGNQRANDAGAFKIGFYFSTDATITTGDTLVASCSYTSLLAGASTGCSGNIQIPSNLAPRSYYFGVITDYQSSVAESDEGNNARATGPINITSNSRPDLIATSLTAPSSGVVGGQIAISSTVYNQGNANAGAFRIGFYYSTDTTITTSDIFSGAYCSPSSLGAGLSYTCSGNISVPSSISPGNYYLGAIVDDQGAITESNETNNTRAVGPISIGGTSSPIVWDFNTAGNSQGWNPGNLAAMSVNSGILFGDPAGADPYIIGPTITATASTYRYVELRMASNCLDATGAIYFRTSTEPSFSEDKKVVFTVSNCALCSNAPFIVYNVYMPSNSKWTGQITGLRLDPGGNGQAGTNTDSFGVDYIKLKP